MSILDVSAFLEASRHTPMVDVRTPAEYARGHIPGAHNLPLFTNDERAEIGTLYKQAGRDEAMLRSLDLVGPRLRALVEDARRVIGGDAVLVHCWRGGMRSAGVAWLLGFFGYRVSTLRGGYKAFRQFVLACFEKSRPLRLLGGLTGAGKTSVLHALARRGEPVIDLEGLAHHKGSVFGHLGEPVQPSQEHFENELAVRWDALAPGRTVWLEDESRRIGGLVLPGPLWDQMRRAELYVLDVPFDVRADALLDRYGSYAPDALYEAIGCIGKRLGGLRTRQARDAVQRGDLDHACRVLLNYYDRAYQHSLDQRADRIRGHLHAPSDANPDKLADALLHDIDSG